MALLYITEWGATFADSAGGGNILKTNIIVNQTPVAVGGGALSSVAFSSGTRIARLHLDANAAVGANVAIGANPTAVTNVSMRISPNATEYFAVNPGDKVSVIAASS